MYALCIRIFIRKRKHSNIATGVYDIFGVEQFAVHTWWASIRVSDDTVRPGSHYTVTGGCWELMG